ncbi:MAG: tripartite tricarboxylate transporter substrate binding protein [Comamonas sp.]
MNRFSRRNLLALAALTAISGAALAADPAASYPARPVKIVVPFPPGGSTDVLLRILSPRLSKELGQPIVVENKSGASATVGADFVAKAAPDGYTFLVGTLHHTIAQAVFPKLPYKIDTDLVSVGMLAIVPNLVVVNSKVPAKTVQELVAITKASPDKYDYGSAGPGSAHHLIGEVFKLETGAQLTHIPYRGSAPAVADLLGGTVAVMFDTVPSALPHIKGGKTRALAVTTAKRSTALPNVPTLAETVIPGFDIGTWYGLMAPAGTPAPIVAKVNAELVKLINDPEVRKQLEANGIEPQSSTPAEMDARVKREMTEFARQARRAKLSIE